MIKVWTKEFPHLLFRTKRQHLECHICQRHRLLIRSFSHNMLARREQTAHYDKHLRDQYLDRMRYWSIRQDSRLHSACIAVILDGMDQAKFAYPRSPIMGGKQWANLTRPRAHITGVKIHGYGMFFAISRHDACKDSNHHCELLCHTLTLVQKKFGLDFSRMHLHVQSDNCVREVKNNTIARWCSSNVSRGQRTIWNDFKLCSSCQLWTNTEKNPQRVLYGRIFLNPCRNFFLMHYGRSKERP